MTLQDWFQNFKRNFCNYLEYEIRLADKDLILKVKEDLIFIGKRDIADCKAEIQGWKEELKKVENERDIYYKKSEEAIEDLNNVGLNPVDAYCKRKGYEINNFVYKDKIIINEIKIPCNLREMITPSSFVVEKVRKSITKPESRLLWYQRVMHKVADMVEWTADGRDDNYYYPAYTLQVGRGDCDDHSFAQCSIEPELGTAFGFYIKDGQRIGHAFAVGIVEGDLWIFDATPDVSLKYEGNKQYSINYIITQNSIYVVNDDTDFGDILW